ncbi:MAG TPA: ankyrin repeat domain-containing protein [Gammaproteobacteria bacterium]
MPRAIPAFASVVVAWAAVSTAAADESLADLIQAGDREAALEMIRAGADVNAAQGDGTTPLHWAVYRIDPELVSVLLERGAKADAVNLYGSSPLAEAVKVGHAGLVETLLEAGADVESPNQDGQTALMLAARAGALEAARILIEHGADVNAREAWRGQTALMWAADARQPEITRLLIEHGADVHVRALANDWATQVTSEPRAQYRPTGGLTALLYAARSGCTACVDAILDAGADIDRPNPDGVTPLMIAIDNFAFETAKRLLERGANPHYSDWWGRTALYIATDISSFNSRGPTPPPEERGEVDAIDVIRMLLEAGVDPNPQLNMHRPSRGGNIGRFVDDLLTTGATPLLRAAIGHDVEAVRALLEHGALVDLPNVMGVTPLMAAAGMGVSGRDRSADYGGDVESRAIATLELLLAAGADVNARVTDITSRTARIARPSTMTEREGQTALYGAVKFGWARVVQYLIDHGAEVDIVDALGVSPVDAALGRIGGRDNTVSEEVAAILRNAGGE